MGSFRGRSAVAVTAALASVCLGVSATQALQSSGGYSLLMDVGSNTSTTINGQTWQAQSGFTGGTMELNTVVDASRVLNKNLATTSLVSAGSFAKAVPNGTYRVVLFVAATNPTTAKVSAEGGTAVSIAPTTKAMPVAQKVVINTAVKDRELDLAFAPTNSQLRLLALKVVSTSLDSTTTTTAAPATTTTTKPTTTTTAVPAATTTTTAVTTVPVSGTYPSSPPAMICGNTSLLSGPATAPAGAVAVPAGDNSNVNLELANTTYWFAPGTHTLGTGQYDQIAPSNNSTYIGGPGAILDGQNKNNFAFTQQATGVTIKYLTIKNFNSPTDQGVVNHDSGAGWKMSYNTVINNGGAGLFVGQDNTATYNCLSNNSQYGFQAYGPNGGESNIILDHNEISGNNTGDWETKNPGCGCTGGGKFWDVRNVQVTNNYVHNNMSVGLWADTNDANFLFQGNWISDNDAEAIFYEISYNAAIRNNVIIHNLVADSKTRLADKDNFPDSAVHISESGGDARVPYSLVGSPTIDISGNLIQDNYNGVTLWENADRYCNSPANTSSGYCTIVNPSVATITSCNSTNIAKAPYYDDCRWKTQNVKVHDNTFSMNMAAIAGCTATYCGRNTITANYGTYPSWSPYKNDVVIKAINYSQGNVFSSNKYVGPWTFGVNALGDPTISASKWQAAPFNQDAGSSFAG